jgi:glycosyltransferase involved in cell wall biosynthesis
MLLALLFREKPDVVHTHTAKAGVIGRIAALIFNVGRRRSQRCLIVHTFHGHVFEGYFHPAISWLIRGFERLLASMSDRIIAISAAQRADLVQRFAIASDAKTVTIPLGLDLRRLLEQTADVPDYRHELSISPDDVVLGFMGRFVPIKDLGTLVMAYAMALRRRGNLQLILAGDGSERAALEKLIERAGISDRVHALSWCRDLPRFYSTIDVAVLSSRNEGTPVMVIEAMAAGKPVIATAVGGVPDLVHDGVTGVLVPAKNANAFSDAIVRLASDREERSAMGRAARCQVRDRYSDERLVKDLQTLYANALRAKRN